MLAEIIEAIEKGVVLFPGEEIKDVVGYEGLYQVTSFGRVWGIKKQIWLVLCTGSKGYLQVSLSKNGLRLTKSVHILVLEAFKGERKSNNLQTRHLDGNPLNNHIDNLKWGTIYDNSDDSFYHGTMPLAEKHYNAKLRNKDVLQIRELYKNSGYTQKEIADKYNVCEATIQHICKGTTWRSLTEAKSTLDDACSPGVAIASNE